MSYPIFDSHAHYDSSRFDDDRDAVLASLPENGVQWVINCGSDLESSEFSLQLAEKYDHVWFAAGVHPHEAEHWNAGTEQRIRELLAHPKCVAVGEIGLDYHYDFSPRETQRQVLERQLTIAAELGKPVILHDREAHGDMYTILRRFAPLRGVMHCFSGSVELMEESVRYGLHIGLGGAVTFKNARQPVEVAAATPADRLLLETDCPYMSPVPHRGERCVSPMISLVADRIAVARGCSADEVLRTAAENASELFGIKLDR